MDDYVDDAPSLSRRLRLFALEGSKPLGRKVGRWLDVDLSDHEEREFADGEHKIRPLVSVRDRDVFVVHSLAAGAGKSVNDRLCRLLFFIGALKDASAARVTAVVPYLCYSRKDQKTQSRDPLTIQYVARMFEAVGTDRVVTCDVHNLAAYQNAFRCRTEHLTMWPALAGPFSKAAQGDAAAIVSPDAGGLKRARVFRDLFARKRSADDVSLAVMDKRRGGGEVIGEQLYGEVADRTAIIIDDLISTGSTLCRAVDLCVRGGASQILAGATHGLLLDDAEELVTHPSLDRLYITNTVQPGNRVVEAAGERMRVVDTAPFLAEALRRLHTGESLSNEVPG